MYRPGAALCRQMARASGLRAWASRRGAAVARPAGRTRPRATLAALALAALAALPALDARADRFCAPDDERAPCAIRSGTYHARIPDGPGPFPAVVVLHTATETGAELVYDPFYVESIVGRGFALIAPNGRPQEYADGSRRPGWNIRKTATSGRDDTSFLRSVIAEAAQRFRLDPDRILLTGYGNGASLVWETACAAPGTASAYAPINGGFYEALPARCGGPVRLMQIHGTGNGFWPLDEARETAPGAAAPIPAARHLELGARLNGCFGSEESGAGLPPGFSMRRWSGCVPGSDLGLLLHEEGDSLPAAVFEVVLDWFAPPRSAATPKAPRAGAGFRKAGEGFGGIGKRPPGD